MTIFYDVAIQMIRERCTERLKDSEQTSTSWLGKFQNAGVSAAKRSLLQELIKSLPPSPAPKNDLEGLHQLVKFLLQFQANAVEITRDPQYTEVQLPGATEKMLADLSASLQEIFHLFNNKPGLIDIEYNSNDPLKHFFFLIGLYHAKIKLRQSEGGLGTAFKYVADPSPFILEQERLVDDIFALCSKNVPTYDDQAPAPSSRAAIVWTYVRILKDEHRQLMDRQTLLVKQTASYSFCSSMLEECLTQANNELAALLGINAALESRRQGREGVAKGLLPSLENKTAPASRDEERHAPPPSKPEQRIMESTTTEQQQPPADTAEAHPVNQMATTPSMEGPTLQSQPTDNDTQSTSSPTSATLVSGEPSEPPLDDGNSASGGRKSPLQKLTLFSEQGGTPAESPKTKKGPKKNK